MGRALAYFGYLGCIGAGSMLKWLPYPILLVLGGALAGLRVVFRPDKTIIAFRNLTLIFPRKRLGARLKILLAHQLHRGLVFLEWICLPVLSAEDLKQKCELTHFALPELTRKHGGLILLSHMGHWGLLLAYYQYAVGPIACVSSFSHDSFMGTVVQLILKKHHVILLPESRSTFHGLRLLRQKYSIAVFLDHPVSFGHGVRIPLFGKDVYTNPFLANLHMRTHQYVFPVSCYRKWYTHKFVVSFDGKLKPDIYALKHYQKQIHELTLKYQSFIERWTKAYPAQCLIDSYRT